MKGMRRIRSGTRLDDAALTATQKRKLQELTGPGADRQVRRSSRLADARARRPSKGVVTLFTGNSALAKTTAATALASELGLPLYRIDLARVVSKYIGETEKNLERVFDAAEDSGSVLLIDEADALFGKRSNVKDSHDRYANIEVSYLLQRIEKHPGVVILATNSRSNLDPAFTRRLRAEVRFRKSGKKST